MTQHFDYTNGMLEAAENFTLSMVGEEEGRFDEMEGVRLYKVFGEDPFDQRVYHLEETDTFFVECSLNGSDVINVRLLGRGQLFSFVAFFLFPIVQLTTSDMTNHSDNSK